MATFDQKLADLKRAHEAGVVAGLRNVSGIAYRLDIDVLLSERPDAFNLFLIALDELQSEKSDNIMGYYQIAGTSCYEPSGPPLRLLMTEFHRNTWLSLRELAPDTWSQGLCWRSRILRTR